MPLRCATMKAKDGRKYVFCTGTKKGKGKKIKKPTKKPKSKKDKK